MIAVGLALFALGMAGLATMARRSVSLRLLRARRAGVDPGATFDGGVAERVAELFRYRLAVVQDGSVTPTRLGRRVLRVVRLLRRLTGVPR